MLFSVVIPTHNRSCELNRCLDALRHEVPAGSDVEIFVIDDGSLLAHQAANARLCAEQAIIYHYEKERRGPASCRNAGIKKSLGEWVAFLDDDVCVEAGWLSAVINAIKRCDERIVGFEGRVVATGCGLWDSEVANELGGLCLSANIIYKKDILIKAGMFDDGFDGPYAEDVECAIRMRQYGVIEFDPRICVCHQPRAVNGLQWCIGAPKRMYQILSGEYRLFVKHPQAYHTVRHARHFFGTWLTLAGKNVWYNVRRRRFDSVIRRPIDLFWLITGSAIEQVAAVFLIGHFLPHYCRGRESFFTGLVDWQRTKQNWHSSSNNLQHRMYLQKNGIRQLLFAFTRSPIYSIDPVLKSLSSTLVDSDKQRRIFLRVDDVFVSDKEAVDKFCLMMKRLRIPFLAAMKGDDLTTAAGQEMAREIVDAGGTIALHGFLHSGKFGPYPSELIQLSFLELDKKLSVVNPFMTTPSNSVQPSPFKLFSFIPPFNAISREQILHLSNQFAIICTGPETLRNTDYCAGPLWLKNGSVVMPSLHPYYGTASSILNHIKKSSMPDKGIICCTVHLTHEAEDGFFALERLIDKARVDLCDWNTLGDRKDLLS